MYIGSSFESSKLRHEIYIEGKPTVQHCESMDATFTFDFYISDRKGLLSGRHTVSKVEIQSTNVSVT